MGEAGVRSLYFDLDPGYFLGAHFAYRPDNEEQFLHFLKTTPIPLSILQTIERTAKARGNIELGRSVHRIFESREPCGQYLKLEVEDAWNDTLYLKRGSTSVEAWGLAQRVLKTASEKEDFARALGFFVSVSINEQVDADILRRFSTEVSGYYSRGIPAPPRLRISTNGDSSGHCDPISDTISMTKWDDGTYIHELAHFTMDLMDDRNGPNPSAYQPRRSDGTLLFDPDDCNSFGSVSQYGGVCDSERIDRTSKKHEDPAETFSWVMQSKEGLPFKAYADFGSSLIADMFESHEKIVLELIEKDQPLSDILREELPIVANLIHEAFEFYQPPPVYEGDDHAYILTMKSWIDGVKRDIFEKGRVLKEEKIRWMEEVVRRLSPRESAPGRPDTDLPPWEAAFHLRIGSPDEPLYVNQRGLHYRVIGKSRQEGEGDLRRLTQTSSAEEGWVFVEATDSSGKLISIWYEVGMDSAWNHVDFSRDFIDHVVLGDLRNLGLSPQSVSEYHIHPLSDKWIEWTGGRRARASDFVNFFSPEDYAGTAAGFFANIPRHYSGDWNAQAADVRIVAPEGIWKFVPQRDGNMDSWPIIQNIHHGYSVYLSQCGLPEGILGKIPIIGIFASRKQCTPSEIIQRFSTPDIAIEFTPFKN